MRSLPEIANERISGFTSAISNVRGQVMVKGFLGPSIRENNDLPSVGVRAARRAGIIVDDNGKMRCPPGTPNANQFTDMQMSNCMVPSAETLVSAAKTTATTFKKRKVSRKLAEEFRALGLDVDISLEKESRLTPEQKKIVKQLAVGVSYWATHFGNFGDIGSMVNDLTGSVGDSDGLDGIDMLTSMFVVGGMSTVSRALEVAKEKWNKTREEVSEYQKAFAERMQRLRIRGGQLAEDMNNSLGRVMESIRERIKGIDADLPTPVDGAISSLDKESNLVDIPMEEEMDAPKWIAMLSASSEPINPDILSNVGVKQEELYGMGAAQISTPQNVDAEQYPQLNNEQKRLRTANNER